MWRLEYRDYGDTAYACLGVCQGASTEEIKTAYKATAKRAHPDKETGSHEFFVAVTAAYSILTEHRDAYNRELRYSERAWNRDIDSESDGWYDSSDEDPEPRRRPTPEDEAGEHGIPPEYTGHASGQYRIRTRMVFLTWAGLPRDTVPITSPSPSPSPPCVIRRTRYSCLSSVHCDDSSSRT